MMGDRLARSSIQQLALELRSMRALENLRNAQTLAVNIIQSMED